MDIGLLTGELVGVIAAICIIKRGLWKIRHIGHNRKLIKDEAWKDIHMTVPRRIVGLTIISMCCYIVYTCMDIIIHAMLYFGYSYKALDQTC